MKRIPLPSQEYLRECFDYDPDTGVLTWRERPLSHFQNEGVCRRWHTRFAHKPAGHTHYGYGYIRLKGYSLRAHRLIYKLVYGEEPDILDHINRDKLDNRLENLRAVTSSVNNHNSATSSTSGYRGVYKNASKWSAHIRVDTRLIYIGHYDTPEEAHEAYKAAAQKYYPGINKDLA